jgi:hypothetical protein
LTIRADARALHGLSFDASYTLSHSIDDASDAGATNAEFNLPQNIYNSNLEGEKADSSFDHRNRLVGNLIYDIPAFAHHQQIIHSIADGWRFGAIFVAQSGAPFSINLGPSNDVANVGLVNGNNIERPNVSGNPNHGRKNAKNWFDTTKFSLPTPLSFGNSPRNEVVGPGFSSLDCSLQKEFPLREDLRVQLRADAYNIANRPNFNLPGRIFGASNFGVVSSALDPRQMQFSAKLTF